MPEYKLQCSRCNKEWESKRPLVPCPSCNKKDKRELLGQVEGTSKLKRRKEPIDELELSGMPVETINAYNPKHKLPVYTKITDSRFNDYKVGNTYKVRIQDPEEGDEKEPYNYVHEAILIAKRTVKFGDIEDMLLAFDSNKAKKSEAKKQIIPEKAEWSDDTQVLVCVFLRKDMVQEFVTSEMEVIEPEFSKDKINNE